MTKEQAIDNAARAAADDRQPHVVYRRGTAYNHTPLYVWNDGGFKYLGCSFILSVGPA